MKTKKLLFALILALMISCDQDKSSRQQDEETKDTTIISQQTQSTTEWRHTIDWFEIAVNDLDRAKEFYETILNIQMKTYSDTAMGGYSMAFFSDPEGNDIVTGALVKSKDFVPGDKGTVVYLNADPDLSETLARIEPAGGKIIMPKMGIGEENEHGFMAMFMDTEGNKVALHSQQ